MTSPDPGDQRRRTDELLDALAYDELRAIAGRIASSGRWPDRDPTSLLHEALSNWMHRTDRSAPPHRDALLASMVTVIRNAAIDRARRRAAVNLPMAVDPTILDDGPSDDDGRITRDTLELIGRAVDDLRARSPRAALALELRFLGGMEVAEVASALSVSLAQAKRDITAAKAFVRRSLERSEEPGRDA